ncbi:uncharacterized protein LOC123384588 isoform X2 [Felis catus]|uniref:uncharacterized protein LOC123384588 isoform X2 n=1 Tax=Felis catus TaxID=9685 RepID=UPI001D1996F6|nr:uncharacterized protein LOC123384588 isoform X2 [Felis catus]
MDDLLRDWCEGPVAETYLCFPKPCPLSFQGLGRLEESLKSEEKGPSEGSLMDAYWRPLETSPPAVMTHLGGPLPAWAKVFSPPASAFLCLMSTDAGKVGNKGLQRATPSGTPLREAGSSGGTTGEGEHGNSESSDAGAYNMTHLDAGRIFLNFLFVLSHLFYDYLTLFHNVSTMLLHWNMYIICK